MPDMPISQVPPLCSRYATSVGGLLFVLILLTCRPAVGAGTEGLYRAEVPVAGQRTEQRNAAIREAFRKVLVKVTGNSAIAKREGLQPAIGKAAAYVQKYRYRLAAESDSAKIGDDPQRLLEVEFDEGAVNRLLEGEGLPTWGRNRPLILVWLGIEKGGERVHLTPGTDVVIEHAVLDAGRDRGLPLMLPLMDLEDRSRLQISDLWGGFSSTVRNASRRYDPDLIIFGRLHRISDQLWRAHWTLLKEDGSSTNWKSEGSSGAVATKAGLQQLANRLAARSAPIRKLTDVVKLEMRVGGIQFLGDYERVQDYLQGLNSVERAELLFAEPQAVVFALRVRGGRGVLEREISLGSMLQRDSGGVPRGEDTGDNGVSGPAPSSVDEMALYYQLQP
jgi:hypothetical protein